MQNLFAFLRRFRVFIFFAALQFLCFILYLQFVSYPQRVFMSTAGNLNATVSRWERSIFNHFYLEENNKILRIENARLRKRVFGNYYQKERAVFQVKDTSYEQKYSFIPAKIIHSSTNNRNNYFTIDVGTLQGIKKDMGVISPRGVVGIVFKTGEHYSLVKSVLTQDINLDVIIGADGPQGILKWDGINPRNGIVTGVSSDLPIKKYASIYTLGASGIFPKGIKVARIIDKERVEDQSLWELKIKFTEDYRTLHSVYVINSLHLKELKTLQLEIPEEE